MPPASFLQKAAEGMNISEDLFVVLFGVLVFLFAAALFIIGRRQIKNRFKRHTKTFAGAYRCP